MLLEVKDIRVRYDGVEAIKGASLGVDQGEGVTLIGSNGAGKSTILRTIIGLKSPASGQIWFQGQRIDRLKPQEIAKRGIALVPEGRRIFPYMSVLDNLRMGAFVVRDGGKVQQTLEKVFSYFPILKERQGQAGGSLSGGEQQMLAIGRALMAQPQLLLLDEPSLGLAPLLVRTVGDIIVQLHGAGLSIVLVEQNARMALRVAQRGYLLETGNIILQGLTPELQQNDLVKRSYLGL